jgi:hypothetical protein
MRRPPPDREILRKIHKRYYEQFGGFKENEPELERESKIYVPIDCVAIAQDLSVDPDIVFGRLYYHLEKKYGYTQQDGSRVHLFAFAVGKDRHAVHFPLLSAVLAELEQSWFQFTAPLIISASALILSIIGLVCRGS